MKIFLSSIIGICIILESTVMPIPITLIAFLLFLPLFGEDVYIWSMFAGIFLDLFVQRFIGTDSLIMLLTVYIFSRYHRKIHPGQNFFTLIIELLIITFYSLYFYKNLDKATIVMLLISAGIIYTVISNLLPENIGKKRLSL